MGMFRTIYAEFPCDHCNEPFRVGVQFKTGDDGLEEYQSGHRIKAEDSIEQGEVYGGIAERFCDVCFCNSLIAQDRAKFDAYIDLIKQGSLELRKQGEDDTPLSVEAVAELRDQMLADWQEQLEAGPPLADPTTRDDPFEIRWKGEIARGGDGPYINMMQALGPMIEQRLELAGWGDDWNEFSRGYEIYVTPGRRIKVRKV